MTDIEEKAKAYDEALQKAKRIIDVCVDDNTECRSMIACIQQIFPELRESEDERIRKALINGFKDYKGWDEEWFDGITVREAITWLEKQGEQKHADKVEPKFKVGDLIKLSKEPKYPAREIIAIKNDAYYFDEAVYLPFNRQDEWELVEQKPADKVEPKFKAGDWLVNIEYGNVVRVLEVLKNNYRLDYGVDTIGTLCTELVDNDYRLWTIQDAKDGDVIFYDNGWTCIFKNIHGIWYSSYCFITADGEFYTGYERHAVDAKLNGNANLATKEQRDLLFQKMHEARYEWDAEHKQLNKIEQKTAWSEEDERYLSYAIHAVEDMLGNNGKNTVAWLKSLKDKYTWKPSDEQMLAINTAINVIGKGTINGKYLVELHEQLLKLREK